MGAVQYQRGQFGDAIERFQKVLDNSADQNLKNLARFYLAESLVATGRYSDAKVHLVEFLTRKANAELLAQARFRLGEVSFMVGDREGALVYLNQFIESNSQHPLLEYALPYLGEIRLARNECELAVNLFQKFLRKFPSSQLADEVQFGLARALEENNLVQKAERIYLYLVARPESGRAAHSLLQLGRIAIRQHQYVNAENYLNQFRKAYPDHELLVTVLYWLGKTKARQQDFVAAQSIFQDALFHNPKSEVRPAIQFELAGSYVQLQRLADAIVLLKELKRDYSDSQWADDGLLLNLRILKDNRQFKLAVQLCREFYRCFPDSPLKVNVIESEAECHFALEQYQKSADLYGFLIDHVSHPIHDEDLHLQGVPVWQYKLAVCLVELGRADEAAGVLQEIDLQVAPRELRSAVRLALATIQIKRNQLAFATRNLILYVEENPTGDEVAKCVADIALLMTRRGNFQAADDWVRRVVGREPRANLYLTMADHAFKNQQFFFAADWYEKSAQLVTTPTDRLRAMMGQVWAAKELGDIQGTLVLAQQVAKEFPEDAQGLEALYLLAVLNEKSGNPKDAIAAHELLIQRFPSSKYFEHSVISLVGLYRNEKIGKVQNLEQPLKSLVANSKSERTDLLMYELAWVLKDIGKSLESQRCFRDLAERFPASRYSKEAVFQDAVLEHGAGNTRDAVSQLEGLSQTELDTRLARLVDYQLGQIYFHLGDFDHSFRRFKKLTLSHEASSLVSAARYWAAETRYKVQDWNTAEKLFSRIAENPETNQEYYEESLLRLGQSRVKLKSWGSAITAALKLIETTKDGRMVAEAQFVIGRSNSGLGQFSMARDSFQAVLDNSASRGTETAAMAQWMIGESWFHQKKIEQAIDAFQRTESLHGHPAWKAAALLQAAKCFEIKSDFEKAKINYRRILDEHSDSEFAGAARKHLGALPNSSTGEISINSESIQD